MSTGGGGQGGMGGGGQGGMGGGGEGGHGGQGGMAATTGGGQGGAGGSGGEGGAPACNDGVANGNETGLDCGGPNCLPCANGQPCAVASDCVSGGCDATGMCAPWAKHLYQTPSSGAFQGGALAVGGQGDIYVGGTLDKDMDLGGGCGVLSPNAGALFVARMDATGACVQANTFAEQAGVPRAKGMVASPTALLVVGDYYGAAPTFGGMGSPSLPVSQGADLFVSTLSPSTLAVVGVRGALGGAGNEYAKAATLDATGDVLVVGTTTDAFGGIGGACAWGSNGGNDGLVVKLHPNGNTFDCVWAQVVGGPSQDAVLSVTTDGATGIYIAGYTNAGTIDFGNLDWDCPGGECGFVAKLDSAGAVVWVKHYEPDNLQPNSKVYRVVADPVNGGVIAAGTFDGNVAFTGQSPVNSQGSTGLVVARLASNGNLGNVLWIPGDPLVPFGVLTPKDVALTGNGDILIAGGFKGQFTVGMTPLSWAGSGGCDPYSGYEGEGCHAFLTKLDGSNLNPLVVNDYGGPDSVLALGISPLTQGLVLLAELEPGLGFDFGAGSAIAPTVGLAQHQVEAALVSLGGY